MFELLDAVFGGDVDEGFLLGEGGEVFDGGVGAAACTTAVAAELALLEPAALEPV